MSESCTHDCSSCGENCASRTTQQAPADLRVPQNEESNIRRVVAVVSGKGGVGKSMVTSLLAAASARAGLRTAALDADITGPSLPQAFGLKEKARGTEDSIFPVVSRTGIKVMSMNLLLPHDTDPVIWRGPVLASMVTQFWQNVEWGDIDTMFVDMPPGTGDVPLTVFQSLPIDGIVVVTSPQQLAGMIVEKAIKMAGMMDIPVLALVENMSFFKCPNCGKTHDLFGNGKLEGLAARYCVETLCRLPVRPEIAAAADRGDIESIQEEELTPVLDAIAKLKGRTV
ncbi:MAG: Mrp/NBP35 family ATP-binding protein [Synergistaceae bacterium]|nr:Mrp/NBP35 family ATP-binding protein [Synergistaceae bacterium]